MGAGFQKPSSLPATSGNTVDARQKSSSRPSLESSKHLSLKSGWISSVLASPESPGIS